MLQPVAMIHTTTHTHAYLPEPLDNGMVGAVAVLVNSVLSPVVDVDVTQTTHEQLHRDKREIIYNNCHVPLLTKNSVKLRVQYVRCGATYMCYSLWSANVRKDCNATLKSPPTKVTGCRMLWKWIGTVVSGKSPKCHVYVFSPTPLTLCSTSLLYSSVRARRKLRNDPVSYLHGNTKPLIHVKCSSKGVYMLIKKWALSQKLKCVRSVWKNLLHVSHLEIFWINICFCFYFVIFDGKIKQFQFIL